ncbi:hypothetical protein HERIO_2310 [Hepatospora eriocheir]|uniref:Uncharacterized protein n=1 Tax=Hepatospora eriocheir TaxID=1081669 RepID=A0A1X0Q7E7_9MICR|nr:hypothetical protein HERIO_2310 [Hepatospora eriocheir]
MIYWIIFLLVCLIKRQHKALFIICLTPKIVSDIESQENSSTYIDQRVGDNIEINIKQPRYSIWFNKEIICYSISVLLSITLLGLSIFIILKGFNII